MSLLVNKIRTAKDAMNIRYIAEDMAFMVMEDLKEAGFNCELKKGHPKKVKTWKIVPTDKLDDDKQQEFDKIKDERTEWWRKYKKDQLKQLKQSMLR